MQKHPNCPLICRVRFEAGPTLYSYFCGALAPKVGDHVVVLVGQDRDGGRKMKIVTVVEVTDDRDPRANTTIYGLVTPQPKI